MQPNLAIIAASVMGVASLYLIARRRPTSALALWVIASVVLQEYAFSLGQPVFQLRLSHLLLAGLVMGFRIARVPSSYARTDRNLCCWPS